jgi:hypothetical protein
VNVTETP